MHPPASRGVWPMQKESRAVAAQLKPTTQEGIMTHPAPDRGAPKTLDDEVRGEAAAGAAAGGDGRAYAGRGRSVAGAAGGHGEVAAVFCAKNFGGETAMFCESYRRKLEDAAVGGERPGVELRRHLTACAKCAA